MVAPGTWTILLDALQPLDPAADEWMLQVAGVPPPDAYLIYDATVGAAALAAGMPWPRPVPPLDAFTGALCTEPAGDLGGCAGLFQPAQPGTHGEPHLACAVLDHGELVDVVAWRPATPDCWRLLTGAGLALGSPPDDDSPVAVWRTPMERLRALEAGAKSDGLVPLRLTPGLVRAALVRCGPNLRPRDLLVASGDRDFAIRLDELLLSGLLPAIVA